MEWPTHPPLVGGEGVSFKDLEVMTWEEFQELFMGKYFPETARHAKAQEFL